MTWTYLARNGQGAYQMVDDQLESTLAAAWGQARKRDYPAITVHHQALHALQHRLEDRLPQPADGAQRRDLCGRIEPAHDRDLQ